MRWRRLDAVGDDLTAIFRDPAEEGGIELMASAATHAVLPLLGHHRGRAAADRRRAALAPPALRRAGRVLAARVRVRARARARCSPSAACAASASISPRTSGAPRRSPRRPPGRGRWRSRSTGRRSRWLWSGDGYPSDPVHADFHRKSLRGTRPWAICGEPYDPGAATERAREQGREFLASLARRLAGSPCRSAAVPASCVFAIDTELLGPLVVGGPGVARGGARRGRRGRRRAGHPQPGARAPSGRETGRSSASTWGEGKDLRTWDSPPGRRPRLGGAATGAAADPRRSRRPRRPGQRSALRASCWPCRRATGRSSTPASRPVTTPTGARSPTVEAMLEAIHSAAQPDGRLRNLAPDLSLAPLLGAVDPMSRTLILSWEYPPLIEGGLARHVRKLSEALVERGDGGPRAHPRRRGVARGGGRGRRPRAPRDRADPADRPRASSSPGSSA